MRVYDFHIHTTCSDGADSPGEVLRKAEEAGLAGLSITDHDTVDAYAVPEVAGRTRDRPETPWVLPGVELSTRLGESEAHIIGYFPGGITADIAAYIEDVLEKRRARIARGVRLLREKGYDVSLAECQAVATGRVVNLQHLARVLVARRYVGRTHRAYDRILSVVPLPEIEAGETVRRVRDLGGLAVWAHPARHSVEKHIEELAQEGLEGVEVAIPRRKRSEWKPLAEEVRTRGLLVTGGSDCHGGNPGEKLGAFRVGESLLEEFLERLDRPRQP